MQQARYDEPPMIHALKRSAMILAGMVGCSALCLLARPSLVSPRGAWGPSILQAESPVMALIVTVVCITLAAAVALVVARLTNLAVGLFCLGWGIFVLCMRLESAEELIWAGGSISLLGLESLILGAVILGIAVVMYRIVGPFEDIEPEDKYDAPGIFSKDGLIAAIAGLAVVPGVWFVAKSETPAQAIGAVFVGSVVAGMVGRLIRPHVQPILLFAAPIFFGAICLVVAARTAPADLENAFVTGRLMPLIRAMPLHYAAGSLLGVSVGLGWVRSFLFHEEEEQVAQRAPDRA